MIVEGYGTEVVMTIKAPNGARLTLFETEPEMASSRSRYRNRGTYTFPKITRQCKVIKAFMKEHRNARQ